MIDVGIKVNCVTIVISHVYAKPVAAAAADLPEDDAGDTCTIASHDFSQTPLDINPIDVVRDPHINGGAVVTCSWCWRAGVWPPS